MHTILIPIRSTAELSLLLHQARTGQLSQDPVPLLHIAPRVLTG